MRPRTAYFPPPGAVQYTQVPNVFFERVLPEATISEARVVGWILRQTRGYQRLTDCVPRAELIRHAGVSNGQLSAAIRGCIEKGWILAYDDGVDGKRERYFFLNDSLSLAIIAALEGGHLRVHNLRSMNVRAVLEALARLGLWPPPGQEGVQTSPVSVEVPLRKPESPSTESVGVPIRKPERTSTESVGPIQKKKDQRNSEKKQHRESAAAALVSLGVAEKIACRLVSDHGAEAVLRQAEWMAWRDGVSDPAAFVVQAIREDYPPPARWTRREEEKEERERVEAAMRDMEAEEAARTATIEAALAALTPADRAALEEEARARVRRARYPETPVLVQAFMHTIIADRLDE